MLILKAKAKVNLFLHCLGKLDNGYHNLQSLCAFADVYDVLYFKFSSNFKLNIIGDFAQSLSSLDSINNNLITQIFNFFSSNYNLKKPLEITLNKKLPLNAGLGGGSSNGAITILAINKLYNLKLSINDLINIGIKFGADIPTCLYQKANFFENIGEKTTSINLPKKLPVILINPLHHVSTKEIFLNFKNPNTLPINVKDITHIKNTNHLLNFLSKQKNDLTSSAIELNSAINPIINELSKSSTLVRMSGSGSSVFAIYPNFSVINNILPSLYKKFPNYWIKASYLQ